MIRLEASVEISKAVSEVFAYVSNPARAPEWMSRVITVASFPPGDQGVGTTLHIRSKLLGRVYETTYEAIEYAPPHRLTCKSIAGPASSLLSMHCARAGENTLVTLSSLEDLAAVFAQVAPLAARAAQQAMQADLLTLKDLLEQC